MGDGGCKKRDVQKGWCLRMDALERLLYLKGQGGDLPETNKRGPIRLAKLLIRSCCAKATVTNVMQLATAE